MNPHRWLVALRAIVFVSASFIAGCGGTVLENPPSLQSIAVTPATPSIAKGVAKSFVATGTYSDGTSRDITASVAWTSTDTGVATVNTSGLVTGVATGTSIITATSGSVSGSATLTVTAAVLQSIAVTPTNPSLPKGLTQQMTATGTYSDGTSQDITATVTWSSSDTGVATVNVSGLATGVSDGISTITATSGAISGSATLTVTAAVLQSIAVTPAAPSLPKGLTQQMTATGIYSDGTSQNLTAAVTWSSSSTAAVTVNTAGLATTVATGTSTITATVGAIAGSTTLTVNTALLQSIAVTPANPSIPKGLTQQFTATGAYSDGTTYDVTAVSTWSSGATTVATVNVSGLATGVSSGTAILTATSGAISGSATLTVTAAVLQSIVVTPATLSLPKGLTQQMTATGTYSDATSQNITATVTWTSSATTVATVNAAGLATGVATGTTTLTATSGTMAASTALTVTPAALQSITVAPANPSISPGQTQQLMAIGLYSDGTEKNATATVTWTSSNTVAATVNASGLASGVTADTATISATSGAITGGTVLTVATYSVGGTATGVTGTGLVLQDNGGNNLTVAANGAFTFATKLAADTIYNVTVLSTPAGELCSVVGGKGQVMGNVTNVAVNCYSTTGTYLALLAGNMDGPGTVDGFGASARFNEPTGLATDSWGNVYVADAYNQTIRKITPAGTVTTLAGAPGFAGGTDGTGAAARFDLSYWPYYSGIATDGVNNVYVADTNNNTIRKITPAGSVTTLAGSASSLFFGGYADGTGSAARFSMPCGVATDGAGNVYVGDTGNGIIRKVTPAGVVTTFAGTAGVSGSTNGTGAVASFNGPSGIASDSLGNLYVADYYNSIIRKITPAAVVTTFAGGGGNILSMNGTGTAATFINPAAIGVDISGNVYVGEWSDTRKITPAAVVSTLLPATPTAGAAADSAGNVYLSDMAHGVILKVTPAGTVSTLAGSMPITGSADGTGASALFNGPSGPATDTAGNIYVADWNNTIRKITTAGVVSTFAGAGTVGSVDGTGSAASFKEPTGVATDTTGNLYVVERGNSIIRKITPTGVVTTLAGTAGVTGSANGTGAAASFYYPQGIATDPAGNVYVADTGNSLIRKITPAGVVTTLAGSGANGWTNGTGTAASFCRPTAVATDAAANVYVADDCNNIVRMITPTGAVTTLAGTAGVRGSADGTGPAASFNFNFNGQLGIAVSSAGNVYVTDNNNSTIRKITPAGVVTTVVGVAEQAGFVPGALPGVMNYPTGVTVSGTTLYITGANGVAVVYNVP